MDRYDSIYFLSKIKDDKMINKKTCFLRNTFDIEKYMNHLKDSEKMRIIRYNDKEKFLDENPEIYYENDYTKEPKCDKLYTKINNYYFVENSNYFQKYAEYYHTIYSAIFPKMGLYMINLQLSNEIDRNSSVMAGLNTDVAGLEASSTTAESSLFDKRFQLEFVRDPHDISMIKLLKEKNDIQKIEHIYNNFLSESQRKKMYYESLYHELPYINKCLTGLKKITTNNTVKNTNTKKVNTELNEIFPGFKIGFKTEYSEETHVNNQVNYILEFYELKIPEIKPLPLDTAVIKIQASFRGKKARESINNKPERRCTIRQIQYVYSSESDSDLDPEPESEPDPICKIAGPEMQCGSRPEPEPEIENRPRRRPRQRGGVTCCSSRPLTSPEPEPEPEHEHGAAEATMLVCTNAHNAVVEDQHSQNHLTEILVAKMASITQRYEMNFYISSSPRMFAGPWPINCKEEDVFLNISTLDDAKEKAKKLIKKDPKNSIIEIVENFIFPVSWTYTVKLFIKTEEIADVHVGPGRRYVAFDSNEFCDKDTVINTLKIEGYYYLKIKQY